MVQFLFSGSSRHPSRAGFQFQRRIVYWFGDAPSLDPGSDGTTLSSALAALSANCIEVFAVDVSGTGSLDDGTGQVPALVMLR